MNNLTKLCTIAMTVATGNVETPMEIQRKLRYERIIVSQFDWN